MRSELQVAQFADMLMALRCEECWTPSAGDRHADRANSHHLAAGRRGPRAIKQASAVGFGNPTAPSTPPPRLPFWGHFRGGAAESKPVMIRFAQQEF